MESTCEGRNLATRMPTTHSLILAFCPCRLCVNELKANTLRSLSRARMAKGSSMHGAVIEPCIRTLHRRPQHMLQRSTASSTDSCYGQVSVSALADPMCEDDHSRGRVIKGRRLKPPLQPKMGKERSPRKHVVIKDQIPFAELPPSCTRKLSQVTPGEPSTTDND